jgi:hypothetical protein
MKKGYWISLYTKIDNQENLEKICSDCNSNNKKLWRDVPLSKRW